MNCRRPIEKFNVISKWREKGKKSYQQKMAKEWIPKRIYQDRSGGRRPKGWPRRRRLGSIEENLRSLGVRLGWNRLARTADNGVVLCKTSETFKDCSAEDEDDGDDEIVRYMYTHEWYFVGDFSILSCKICVCYIDLFTCHETNHVNDPVSYTTYLLTENIVSSLGVSH